MTVNDLIAMLSKMPSDATVIISSGDYPSEATSVEKIGMRRFDGYISPGMAAKNRICVVLVSGGN